MRGEEYEDFDVRTESLELPPHARRRDIGALLAGDKLGITSACAEKRRPRRRRTPSLRNYLRMRGEELC